MVRIRKYGVQLVQESAKTYDILDRVVDSSSKAQSLVRSIADAKSWHNEKFCMVCLNSQNVVIGYSVVSEGTLNEAPVYPREIATRALLNNANGVILFHNHPGGSLKFSSSDIAATREIKKGLEVLQIKLVDHILINMEDDSVSMAEKGLI